ncbi:basic leucine zipper 61-like [Cornus florida]|uniref:basic leucine zipper 61-like n=1 Tax=Cornus florida TaxID=4283 RepID=UPI0028A09970|nr:basic leucine zipper 61-like [Cornus florida]
MAQLPPKVPHISPNWPEFSHQRMPSLDNFEPNTTTQNPSWVDDFLSFSSAKHGSHRRSVSDSIAFLDPPIASGNDTEFDRLDDEHLMSMFTDQMVTMDVGPTVSYSNPSTPSDHNSINDDKQTQPDQQEVQSSCELDTQHATPNNSSDKIIDPKRVKRILANRQSAQRSRVRKLQYITELERTVTSLQAEVSVLSPRVAFLDHQRLLLNVDNNALKERIAALTQDKLFKDAHQEALKREIERLRQVYYHQNLKKMEITMPPSSSSSSDANASMKEEQLVN